MHTADEVVENFLRHLVLTSSFPLHMQGFWREFVRMLTEKRHQVCVSGKLHGAHGCEFLHTERTRVRKRYRSQTTLLSEQVLSRSCPGGTLAK